MDKLLSAREVAERLGVAYKTAYRLIRSGEVPAMRVGGVYRVSESDLERYLEESRVGRKPPAGGASVESSAAGMDAGTTESQLEATDAAAVPPVTCGLCKRIIGNPEAAAKCECDDCEELLCRVCSGGGERFCVDHRPTREERLTEARAALVRGDVDVLVGSESAASMEQEFIGGFREQMAEAPGLVHPVSGKKLSNKAAGVVLEDDDELQRLVTSGGNVPRFGWGITHPRNARVVATVGSGREATAVVAQFVSHLTAHARDGFDCAVAGEEDVKRAIAELSLLSKNKGDVPIMAGLASPTGWDEEAVSKVSGAWGSGFSGRNVMAMLIDPRGRRVLSAESLPDALVGYRTLFEKEAPFAGRRRIKLFAEEWLLLHDSLALGMTADDLELPMDVVRDVFNEMASSGKYRFEMIKGAGWVLYPRPAEVR